MIAFLSGTVEHHTENSLFINVHGVGYEVFVPLRLLSSCPLGNTQKIFTYHKISEDSQSLYGFLQLDDIHLFKTLIGVSGIGVKSAMQMMEFPSAKVIQAIESEDLSELTKIPGLGKKTASRLVLELKGKIVRPPESQKKILSPHQEVIDILKSLGFVPSRVEELFANLPKNVSEYSNEELVKWGLKTLSS